jgi:hypothetical protein
MAVNSRFRNKFKQAAQKRVPSFYGLVNMPAIDIAAKVSVALLNGNYRAKSFSSKVRFVTSSAIMFPLERQIVQPDPRWPI